MKNAIAKLMIATMVIDGHIDEKESRIIKGNIQILGITDNEDDELLSEAKEINELDDFLAWIQPALDTLKELQYPDISSLAISTMMLVAYADGKIRDVEIKFIQSTASILGVASPTWGNEEWIPGALERTVRSKFDNITNTDNE